MAQHRNYDMDAQILDTRPVNETKYQRKFGAVDLMAIGMRGVFWAVTHPGKSLFLGLGAFGGTCICVFGAGFALNLLSGGSSPIARGLNPWNAGDAAANAVAPVIDTGRSAVVQTVNATSTAVEAVPAVDPYAASFGTAPAPEVSE